MITFIAKSNNRFISRQVPCKFYQSYSFLHFGILYSYNCCGSASRQMLAKVAPDSVNKWQWIYLNNACTRPENWPTANLRLVSATCAQYGVGPTLVGML